MDNKLKLEAHKNAITKINRIAAELLGAVEVIEFVKREDDGFKSDRPIAAEITPKEMRGDPIFRNQTTDGEFGIAFLVIDELPYGIKGKAVEALDDLISSLSKIKFISLSVSDAYLENIVFEWLRSKKRTRSRKQFWTFVKEKLKQDVIDISVYVPIDRVELDVEARFGPVWLLPFDKTCFDTWETEACQNHPKQKEDIQTLLSQMRKDMQGLAALRIDMQAEQNYAHKAAFEIANRFCDALRIFAPQRASLMRRAPYAPLGISFYPLSHTVSVSGGDGFTYSSSSLDAGGDYWRINQSYLANMIKNNFGEAFEIAIAGPKDDFQKHVWKAIQAFSKSLTPVDLNDRLAFRVSAIEGMLLKSNSEPISTMVGERMAFLLGNSVDDRRQIVSCFKSIYKMRSDYVHHRKTRNEQNDMEHFAMLAWEVMRMLLLNIGQFSTKDDFFDALEKRRYGG